MLIDIFATGKHVNHGGEYLQCFIFMELKRPLNSRKNKIVKIEENLNEIIKHSKGKFMQISYKKSFIWPVIGCVRYREVSSRG